MEKRLAVIKESECRYVLEKINYPIGDKREILHIFPKKINFKDFSMIFNDDGDWFAGLIIWDGKNNGFSSTFDIATFLEKNDVLINYPPELTSRRSLTQFSLTVDDEVDGSVYFEFSAIPGYYYDSLMIYTELTETDNIVEAIRELFKKVYENKFVNCRFWITHLEDDSENGLNIDLEEINEMLTGLWKEHERRIMKK